MMSQETTQLTRDVEAYLVPSGQKVKLMEGETVHITQALGGTYTLIINGNMVQIAGENADAIGKDPVKTDFKPFRESGEEPGEVDEDLVWDQLKTCYDPEIPVNIVDLGLIYDLQVLPLEEGGLLVNIKMTLTAPGCGMGNVIAAEAERKVEAVPGVKGVNVELIWEPQWNRDMMSEAAKLQLGML